MRTIRWGILGTGSISDDFCEGLKLAPGSALHAIASRDPARGRQFAERHGFPHALSLAQLLQSEVDVVYVATPPAQHKEHAIACLEAGKAVLLEKPFAVSHDEAKTIAQCARRSQRFCMEAMWMRFTPLMRELVAALEHGQHGKVLSIEASLGFPHAEPASRGSALLDLGVYPLSFAQAVLGTPDRVQAIGDDAELSIVLARDGAQAVIRCSLRSTLRNDAVVLTDRAHIHVEAPIYRPESYSVRDVAPIAEKAGKPGLLRSITQRPELRRWVQQAKGLATPRVTLPALGNGYAHEAIEVNDCLRSGALESAVMPIDESVAVMQTVDAIRRACA